MGEMLTKKERDRLLYTVHARLRGHATGIGAAEQLNKHADEVDEVIARLRAEVSQWMQKTFDLRATQMAKQTTINDCEERIARLREAATPFACSVHGTPEQCGACDVSAGFSECAHWNVRKALAADAGKDCDS